MKKWWRNITNYEHCPCKDCGERSEGCHGKCEKYGGWKARAEETRKRIREEKDITRYQRERACRERARKWKNDKQNR